MDSRYVQKSKLFLLPLIEIKQDNFIKPKGTYVANKTIRPDDGKLIVPFEKEDSSEFNTYETTYILNSSRLVSEDYYETEKHRIYVFDLDHFREDYELFLRGKYTDFSKKAKTLINIYWGKRHYGKFFPHPKIEAYINPTLPTYEKYAEELGTSVGLLLHVGQLLDPPDLDKETFKEELAHINLNEEDIEA